MDVSHHRTFDLKVSDENLEASEQDKKANGSKETKDEEDSSPLPVPATHEVGGK